MRTTLPKIHNLRILSGDLSAPALLKHGVVRVDRKTPRGNPYPIGQQFGSRADLITRRCSVLGVAISTAPRGSTGAVYSGSRAPRGRRPRREARAPQR